MKLGRPTSKAFKDEVLAAVDEELVGVPMEYVRDVLAENSVE